MKTRKVAYSVAVALGATCALALLVVERSRAYVPNTQTNGKIAAWDLKSFAANVQSERISFHPKRPGTKDDLGSFTDAFQAIRDSFAAWEDVGTSVMRFWEDTFRTAQHHNVQDRVNLIMFVEEELDPFVLGVTFPYEEGGDLVDCDIYLNDDFTWSTKTPGRSGRPDVQAVATHEIGHFLGLDHSPVGPSTMYFAYRLGAIHYRTLSTDDRVGLSLLYPTDDLDATYGRLRGTVNVEGRSDDRGIQMVALDVATNEPVAGALTRPDGSYEILVPPGFYRVVGTPARPSHSLNSYWSSADDRVLPRPVTVEGTAIGAARIFKVTAPGETDVPELTIGRVSSPLEPDDDSEDATVLRVGDMAAARFESTKNDDWFAFDGSQGDVVTVTVHATHIGSQGDPELWLYDTNASTVLGKSVDIRSRLFPQYANGIEGVDVDCRIENVVLPRTGRYYARVRPSAFGDTGGKGDYYAILVQSGENAPSRLTTELTVSPDRIPADGVSTSLIRIVPRTVLGEGIGPGLFVKVEHDGVGSLSPVTDVGDGTYLATLTAASSPGADTLDVEVRGAGGGMKITDAARVVYLGPPDGDTSDIWADPRRLPADGFSTSWIVVVPRDAQGEKIGDGVDVTIETVGPSSGSLGSTVPAADGSYRAALRAASQEGEALVRAVFGGTTATRSVRVGFGFALEAVVRDALLEFDALTSDLSLSSKIRGYFAKASAKLRRADAALTNPRNLIPDRGSAVKDVYKALKSVAKARSKSDDDGLAPSADDLLEGLRRAVDAETGPTGKARALYLSGVSAKNRGDVKTAAKSFYKAYKQAVKDRDDTTIRQAEVHLETDASGTRVVARVASGKLRDARLDGPVGGDLKRVDELDGSRIYGIEASGDSGGTYDLLLEPRSAGGVFQTLPFVVSSTVPAIPTILEPTGTTADLTPRIRWTRIVGVERYAVLIVDPGGSAVFADSFPPEVDEAFVPRAFTLAPGANYTVEVHAIAAGGNRSIARTTIRTVRP